MKTTVNVILLLLSPFLFFTACDNPIGLGTKVNTEKPVIRNAGDENQPGDFLNGDGNRIWLEVEQEFGISEVFMEVEYVNKETGVVERKIITAYYDEERGQWYVDLDTSGMEDGTIKAWVTAIDVDGNSTTTTDIVYFVKNLPPQIKLNMPLVDDSNWDDDAFLDNLVNVDPLYLGFDLMGLATDNYGIEIGYPKIMIWPAEGILLDADGLPMPDDGRYGTWRSLVVPNERNGLTATRFSWPMMYLIADAAAPGGYRLPERGEPSNSLNQGIYRIRIVTKDLFGNYNYYPNRTDNKRGPGGQAMDPDEIPRKYIEINYKASDVPLIQITNYPQYYNSVSDFVLYFSVSSQTAVTSTTASIVDTNDISEEKTIGGPYTPEFLPDESSGALYKYKLTIPAAQTKEWINKPSSGIMFAKIKAVAGDKEGPNTYQNFIFDDKPPSVVIDRPVNLTYKAASGLLEGGEYEIWYPDPARPKWVTGTITVGGGTDDNLTLIKDVLFYIGKLGDDNPSSNRELIYDTAAWEPANLQYTDKAEGWSGGLYSWTYTFDVFDIDYKTTLDGIAKIQNNTDLYYGFPSNTYSETTSAERKRFYLPFYVKVIDSANNFKIIHYKLSVDPLLDEPIVTITQPEIKSYDTYNNPIPPIVGGTVRVSGYAEDNFWMHTVLIRVKKLGGPGNTVGGYPVGTTLDNNYYIPKTDPPTLPFYKSSPGSDFPKPMNGAVPDIDGWFAASKIGDSSMVNWYANINNNQELDPSGSTVNVIVEVVALDCTQVDNPNHEKPNIIGPVETLPLQFSKDVPMITDMKIKKTSMEDRTYKEGITASGVFSFSFDVEAISNINTLTVRVNGASSPITLINGTFNQTVTNWEITGKAPSEIGKNKRNVTVTVNSIADTIPGLSTAGFPYGKTGNLTLEVTAVDATENRLSTTNTFIIGIDNFFPTAVINTLNIASDNPPDKYYFVDGTAQDYGSGTNLVQGLDKVLVYFEKATITYPSGVRTVEGSGTFVKPDGADANPATDFITYPNVLNYGSFTTSAVAPNEPSYIRFPKLEYKNIGSTIPLSDGYAWTSPSAMVIDAAENGGTTDADKDGTFGEIWSGSSSAYKEFGARVVFRSPNDWKDGPYIVHYMILDLAGNATHYQNDIYLENNKPRITSINFGTDINGIDLITDGSGITLNEYLYPTDLIINADDNISSVAGVLSPSFRIRGELFAVRLTVTGGNGSKDATATFVTAAGNIPASNMGKGQVYTIVSQVTGAQAMTDFTKCGAPNNIIGTTFVATGPATGSGTVTSYTSVEGNRFTHPLGTDTSGVININRFSLIPDSDKTGGEILGDNKNKRFFIVKVYDETTATGRTEFDQLADAILVKLDIDNEDSKDPSISVLPFGMEYQTPIGGNPADDKIKLEKTFSNTDSDYIKNIGMNGAVKGGYVQYAYTSTTSQTISMTGTAYVSGKIKFLGKAEDNQRIKAIYATISGYNGGAGAGSRFQIAQQGSFNKIVPINNTEWAFRVISDDDYQTQEFGHTLNWEFMWDSSKHPSVAASGVTVTFTVVDAANHEKTSAKTVNIVPYISEVETPLSSTYSSSPSVFNRSALGGYPVREGEAITIKGFNLGTAVGNATINGTALSYGTNNGTTITSTVPVTASGPLVVRVNSIDSFNNSANKRKDVFYNKEPNGVNNNILDNSRYIYVWNTGDLFNSGTFNVTTNNSATASINMKDVSYPFMRLDNKGNRLISHGFYNLTQTGRLRVLKNNTIIDLGNAATNRMVYTTVGTGGSNTSFYAAGTDLSSAAAYNRGFQLGLSNPAGTDSISDHTSPSTVNNSTGGSYPRHGDIRIIGTDASAHDDRFKIPRIAVLSGANPRTDTTPDRILLCYYDSDSSVIEVVYSSVGDNTVKVPTGSSSNNVVSFSGTRIEVTKGGSEYTAAGLLDDGTPLVAWYNSSDEKLYFTYGTNLTLSSGSATAITWNTAVIDTGKGTHVDMAVDKGNNVHLAYYSNSGGLYYVHIPSTSVKNTGRTVTPVKVDTYLSAGTKIMINVRQETTPTTRYVPYITYAHASFPGTKHSVRAAWLASGSSFNDHGTDGENTFTGKWEVMTVPVIRIPNINEFICNGVPTETSGWTSSGTTLTAGSYLSSSILVGYMTDSVYEGAILKDDIRKVPDELKK